ncbi:MAG: alpha/beta hydrolase [Candidatus Binatia bacterium]
MPTPLEIVMRHAFTLKARFEQALAGGDITAARKVVDETFSADPSCREVVTSLRAADVNGIRGVWLIPDDCNPSHRLLYLHGGGWCFCGLESHHAFMSRVAKATGCAVLGVEYRLAPENPYPAGLDDCVAGYEWMLANGPDGPSPATRTFIAGDSAGGGLTLTTALRVRDAGLRNPDALVPISAGTDFLCTGESMVTRKAVDAWVSPESVAGVRGLYLQHGEDPKHPHISPLYADMRGLPPLYFQVGDTEILLDDATRFVERARAAGVEAKVDVFDGMPHVFQGYAPLLPEALDAFERIGAFVKSKR